jgi:prepilin signal peptidase PulO-like enzyme (type II secretory pathway)
MVFIVSLLCIVQIPLDVRFRYLSRQATVFATVAGAAVVVLDSIRDSSVSTMVNTSLAAVLVSALYYLVHRLTPSSLGFGDVLLVAPLALAVEYVAPGNALVWQLLAASSGALHALITRLRSGSTTVPFGPHLLGAAWLVLVFNL